MNTVKHQDALRTIGEVAKEVKLATHVLRFWEAKFPQIKPQKRRGRRYYGPSEVAAIKAIKDLLYEQGYTVKGVKKYLLNIKRAELAAKRAGNSDSDISEEQEAPEHKSIYTSKDFPDNHNDEFLSFKAAQTKQLTEIYQGLCSARDRLRELSVYQL